MVQSLPRSDTFRILFNSPELSEVQRSGFHFFLKEGIAEELSKISCIPVKNAHFLVEVLIDAPNFRLLTPENNYRDCILKMKSYTCKLYVQTKILFKDKLSGELLYQTQPEWVFLADLPIMTKRGHFVINGSPRIVVHQVGRAPGIYFKKVTKVKNDFNNKARFYGDIIPRKGVWVRLQINKKGEIDLKLKKSKKVRAEMVEKCLELLEKESQAKAQYTAKEGRACKSIASKTEGFGQAVQYTAFAQAVRPLLSKPSVLDNLRFHKVLKAHPGSFVHSVIGKSTQNFYRAKGLLPSFWMSQTKLSSAKEKALIRNISYFKGAKAKVVTKRKQDKTFNKSFAFVEQSKKKLSTDTSGNVYTLGSHRFLNTLNGGVNLKRYQPSFGKALSPFYSNSSVLQEVVESFVIERTAKADFSALYKAEKSAFANVYTSFYKNEIQDTEERASASFAKVSQDIAKSNSVTPKPFSSTQLPLDFKRTLSPSTKIVKTKSLSVTETYLAQTETEETKAKTERQNKGKVDMQKLAKPNVLQAFASIACKTEGFAKTKFVHSRAFPGTSTLFTVRDNKAKLTLSNKKRTVKKANLSSNLKKIREYIYQLFKKSDLYDLGSVGREKINTKFGISVKETQLTALDVNKTINWLSKLRAGKEEIDDIDHSQNRRVRTSSELIQTQFSIGITRLKSGVTKRVLSPSVTKQSFALATNTKDIETKQIKNKEKVNQYLNDNSTSEPKKGSISLTNGYSLKSTYYAQSFLSNKVAPIFLHPTTVIWEQNSILGACLHKLRFCKTEGVHKLRLCNACKTYGFASTACKSYASFLHAMASKKQKSLYKAAFEYRAFVGIPLINPYLAMVFAQSTFGLQIIKSLPLVETRPNKNQDAFGFDTLPFKGGSTCFISQDCSLVKDKQSLMKIKKYPKGNFSHKGLVEGIKQSWCIQEQSYALLALLTKPSLCTNEVFAKPSVLHAMLVKTKGLQAMQTQQYTAQQYTYATYASTVNPNYKKVQQPFTQGKHYLGKRITFTSKNPYWIPYKAQNNVDCSEWGPTGLNIQGEERRTERDLVRSEYESTTIQKRAQFDNKLLTPKSNFTSDFSASEWFSTKPINGALREFFSSSPLSQYMDQTNPLAEVTHKRRISSLGIGGVSRESAGMTIRGIHPTHYGRICPIETPEGKNAGLVNSLAFYARVNHQGFVETPYYQVIKGQIQHELGFSFYSAGEESRNGLSIAPNDIKQSKSKLLASNISTVESIPVRIADNLLDLFKKKSPSQVDCIGISPVQILSVATSLIPFLEHNDANRALMGSNMQRQAVSLMSSERPLIGTGLEARVLAESGHLIQSKASGFISNVSAHQVVVEQLLQAGGCKSYAFASNSLHKRSFCKTEGFARTACAKPSVLEALQKRSFCTGSSHASTHALPSLLTFSSPSFRKRKMTLLPVMHSISTFSRSNQETCLTQKPLVEEGDWVQRGDMLSDCSAGHKGELSVGKNMFIAYIPWQGYNFEDAIVISDRLVKEQLYTSLHIERYTVTVNDFKDKIVDTNEWFTGKLPGVDAKKRVHLQRSGLPKIGTILKEGDILVGKIKYSKKKPATPHERLVCDILGEHNFSVQNTSLYVPKGVHEARVLTYKIKKRFDKALKSGVNNANVLTGGGDLRPRGAPKVIHLFLGEKRNIQVGDKMSGRHGNKGIVSTILPKQDMPYLADGSPIDILLNPLGVPSRMNVGQVFECLLGLASTYLHQNFKHTAFDEIYGVEASQSLVFLKLYQARLQSGQNWLFQVNFPGKTRLTDGRSGECLDQWVTVGRAYMLKLIHMVNEKIHARAIGPYALVTQQPLKGRAHKGGQRLGEMEVWAVEGFGAAYILQELLTKKSDDSIGRKEVLKAMLPKSTSFLDFIDPFGQPYTASTNSKEESKLQSEAFTSSGQQTFTVLGQPDIFKVCLCELQALCLDVGVYSIKTESFQRQFMGVFE